MIDYWDDQAITFQGAWDAVFSEPKAIEHTINDIHRLTLFLTGGDRPLLPEGKLVEIGCGVGRLTQRMSVALNREVIGIDPSPRMIGWAEEAKTVDEVSYVVGDSSDVEWPLAGGYSMLVFQHLGPQVIVDYFQALNDALVDGGKFVFQFVIGDYRSPHDNRYSVNEMAEMAAAGGLTAAWASGDERHPEWCWMGVMKA